MPDFPADVAAPRAEARKLGKGPGKIGVIQEADRSRFLAPEPRNPTCPAAANRTTPNRSTAS
jgi:hypothetical protein